jgi:predicted nucleic acid-binding protein
MEVMVGVPNKRAQFDTLNLLNGFEMIYFTQADMDWAMQQMERYRLSHGLTTNDCFIASVCHRLQVPLLTHNLKDMHVILDKSLAIKPY